MEVKPLDIETWKEVKGVSEGHQGPGAFPCAYNRVSDRRKSEK